MKKKLSFCLVVLVLLAVGVLHYWAAPTFDHAFQCNGIGPPAKPGGSFKVLREGTYPGLSDAPVTFDEGRTYRELLAALRGQRYLRLPALLGAPKGFRVQVRNLKVSAGAGFLVALSGDILTMPGLPKVPAAEKIDVDEHGKISGLF